MSGPSFNFEHEVEWGDVDDVSPMLRRVTAKNPSHFTFKGTGTYIVGRGNVAVIDPGPDDDKHIDSLLKAVDGETVTHILITHTHSDHSPGTAKLKEHHDAPVYAWDPSVITVPPDDYFDGFFDNFPEDPEEKEKAEKAAAEDSGDGEVDKDPHEVPRETIEVEFEPDEIVSHGQRIEGDGMTFEALHTPGHISNHVSWGFEEEKAVFTGDHIMGWSTTVIPAPDGSLTDYMESLQVLIDRPGDELHYPTHGAPISNPQAFAAALAAHRNMRTEQVLECLADGKTQILDMVKVMYADKPIKLYKPAALSVLSHLVHLEDTGRVTTDGPVVPGADWRLT